jgi:hypothetical protein
LVHVPLIVSGPDALVAGGAFGLDSLPAMLARALGLTDAPWNPDRAGIAVAQYDALASRDDPRVEKTAADWGLDEEAIGWVTSRGTAATDGTMKLVRDSQGEHVYNVLEDPSETRPLDPADAPPSLRAAVARAEEETAVVKPGRHGPEQSQEDENAELERRLKQLGYL